MEDAAAQSCLEFYVDLMENSRNLLRYYLSEDVVLDWFGQTVKGQKNVAAFIKSKVNPLKHFFKEAKPVNRIGFRNTHILKTIKPARRILRSTFLSPPRPTLMATPKKQPMATTSAKRPIGKLDFDNGFPSPVSKRSPDSPRKRQKLSPSTDVDLLESENELPEVSVKYLSADGHVEFHRPSLKKLQRETKWQRPCKIHLAYDCGKDIKDSNFYLIIYEGNVKCRRNLMKDFEAEEQEI